VSKSEWITDSLATNETKDYPFDVEPNTTYYVNWEDSYSQGTASSYTADIKVTVSYWNGEGWTPMFTAVDNGWCGETGEGSVDQTLTLNEIPSSASQVLVTVELFGVETPPGTFHLRWSKSPLPGYGLTS